MIQEENELSRMKKKYSSLQQKLQREKLLARCTRVLLTQLPTKLVLMKFLHHLRTASGADQLVYFENFDDPVEGLCMKQIGFSEEHSTLDKGNRKTLIIPYSFISSEMYDKLSSDRSYGGKVSSLPEKQLVELVGSEILSLMILPVFVNERFHGFIEFKYQKEDITWNNGLNKQLETCTRQLGAFFESKSTEEKLKRQKEELSEFAHAMSHDIRNNLTVISGYCELLEEENDPEYLKKINNITETLNKMLTRSVELADAGLVIEKSEDIDLTGLVHEVAKLTIPSSIKFDCDELLTVSGDRNKLTQVFQNIFANAVKHGNPGEIDIKIRKYSSGSRLYIKNDGKPIQLDNTKRIFEHGFTTDNKSSGFGLTIVKKIVEAHGWKIDLVKSTKTNFRIIIPHKKSYDLMDNGKLSNSIATQSR